MREISALEVTEAVKRLCIRANYHLSPDLLEALRVSRESEPWPIALDVLDTIEKNIHISSQGEYPLCQDTGMACVFIELGQEVYVKGNLEEAINEGVREGYQEGYLRKSVVGDPLHRINTKDNTPAIINYEVVPGDRLKIMVAPKGFGSENMSRLKMLKPSDGVEGIQKFVLETVKKAGSNPCPPIVVGVGIGGNFDKVALLSKKALLRPIDERNENPYYAQLELDLLEKINGLGIGPQGFGGRTTALGVNILTYPTHIAGLPVAVNINCHVTRHQSICL